MPSVKADPERLTRLIQAVAGGDEQAFAQLYESCSAQLFGLLLRMLRRRDWAEDALQECFLRVWRKSDSYTPERGAPMTWLLSIARYRALDVLRMNTNPQEIELSEVAEALPLSLVDIRENPEQRAVESDGLGRLNGCMKELRDEHRKCMLLAYYEGYTYPELARVMNVPLNTTKSWVRRGLARLRECLERNEQ